MLRFFYFKPLFTILLLAVLGQNLVRAQQAGSGILKGVVRNAEGVPAIGALLSIEALRKSSTSDTLGRYRFEGIPAGKHLVTIQWLGYEDQTVPVTISSTKTTVLNVDLREKTQWMEGITILGKSNTQILKEAPLKAEIINLKPLQGEASALTETINRSAGIRVRQTGGLGSQASIFINGFTGKSVKFFKDDIPLDYLGEGFNLTLLPVNMLDRVEIYKGVMPAKLGADALGGGVNYVTKSNAEDYADASYEIASFNTHRATLNLYRSPKKGKTFIGLNGFFNHSDNNYKVLAKIVDPVTANRVEKEVTRFHDQFTNAYGEVLGGIRDIAWADELSLSFSSFYTYREVQHDAIMTTPFGEIFTVQRGYVPTLRYKKAFINKKLDLQQFLVYSRINNNVTDTCNCNYDWYGQRKFVSARNGEADSDGSLAEVQFDNFTSRTYLTYPVFKKLKLEFNNVFSSYSRIGADPFGTVYFYSKRDILSVPAGYKKWVSAVGVEGRFFKDALQSHLALKRYYFYTHGTGGAFASYDENQQINTNEAYGASGALKFRIDGHSFLRTSGELAYRLPEQGEVFGDGQFLLSNFFLQPERSSNFNLGYRIEKPGRFHLEPNLFYRITQDQIILVPENLIYLQYQNVEQVKGYGADLDFQVSPLPWWQVFGNLTYQELRLFGLTSISDRFLEGARLRNTPYFFGNTGMRIELKQRKRPQDKLRIFWYYAYTHEYYLSNIPKAQEAPNLWSSPTISTDLIIPSQHLHSAGFQYALNQDKISFGFEVKNVFNSRLFDNFRVQRAGRSLHLKLRYLLQ